MRVLDSVYLFITRGWGGWNNIYHHTEWVNNLLRYVHKAASLPRVNTPDFRQFKMETVAYYPDPINQNKTFGDPKGHFRWGMEYYKLAKTFFPASARPHFLEGAEYSALNSSFCARRGVSVLLCVDRRSLRASFRRCTIRLSATQSRCWSVF